MIANELRVGNYVFDETGEISFIETGEAMDYAEQFNPVPITEDLLIKLGFDKLSEKYYLKYADKFAINVYYTCSGGDWFIDLEGTRMWCNYVHQLQNLYFALTGEELEIK